MNNLPRLREAMSKHGIAAFLATDIDTVSWLTGFTGTAGVVLVTPSDGRFLTDSRYTIQAKEQVEALRVVASDTTMDRLSFIAGNTREMGIEALSFDGSKMTFAMADSLSKKLDGIAFVSVEDPVAPLRLVKTPDEIDKIRAACKLADACIEHASRLIQPGVSEWTVGLEVEFFYRRQGAELAFEPIVVSGERSARPHGRASEKLLEAGDFVTIDCGANLDGYCSDITRTFVVGKASDRHRTVYEEVLRSQVAAIEAVHPGVTGRDVDAVARNILGETDLAKYFGHGLGHGLGRLVHDGGALNPSSQVLLAPGQVWTIEPGVYIEGFGGVRIEDDVVVTPNGCEVLTAYPKELIELPG